MALAGVEALDNVTSTMNLVSLNIESIQLGHPLPFVLRGADGALLAQKGYVIRTREELAKLVERGHELCVDTDESGGSHRAYLAQLQRMLKAAGQQVPPSRPIFEVNPAHPLIARLRDEADEGRFGDLAAVLFDQSLLAEGGQLEDPAGFVRRLNQLMLALGGK